MTQDLVALVSERFGRFSQGFLEDEGDGFAYRLKIRHTAEVAARADEICRGESLPEPVALAARLGAVLHDVGRFPQFRQYRSFRDRDTANHALLSVRHSLRERLLQGVPAPIRKLVLGAVFLHNVRVLPRNLPADLLATVQVVRDADKLDIMRVMLAHFSEKDPIHPEVALSAKLSPDQYSQAMYEAVMERRLGDYRDIVWLNDFKLMVLGWLYDLNYTTSVRLLRDLGQHQRIFGLLPDTEPIRALRAQLLGDLAQRLEGA